MIFQSPQEAAECYFGCELKPFEWKNWRVKGIVAAGSSQQQEHGAKEHDCQQDREDWEA